MVTRWGYAICTLWKTASRHSFVGAVSLTCTGARDLRLRSLFLRNRQTISSSSFCCFPFSWRYFLFWPSYLVLSYPIFNAAVHAWRSVRIAAVTTSAKRASPLIGEWRVCWWLSCCGGSESVYSPHILALSPQIKSLRSFCRGGGCGVLFKSYICTLFRAQRRDRTLVSPRVKSKQ